MEELYIKTYPFIANVYVLFAVVISSNLNKE